MVLDMVHTLLDSQRKWDEIQMGLFCCSLIFRRARLFDIWKCLLITFWPTCPLWLYDEMTLLPTLRHFLDVLPEHWWKCGRNFLAWVCGYLLYFTGILVKEILVSISNLSSPGNLVWTGSMFHWFRGRFEIPSISCDFIQWYLGRQWFDRLSFPACVKLIIAAQIVASSESGTLLILWVVI